MILFRLAWDYIPAPILKWFKYIPGDPFRRMLNLNNLFREYGQRILREQGPDVDAEGKTNSKDMMSLLSKFCIIDAYKPQLTAIPESLLSVQSKRTLLPIPGRA